MNPSEFRQPGFCNTPEVLDPVDMVRAIGELILAMMDAAVLFIANIYQSIIGLEPIGIDDRFKANMSFQVYISRHRSRWRLPTRQSRISSAFCQHPGTLGIERSNRPADRRSIFSNGPVF